MPSPAGATGRVKKRSGPKSKTSPFIGVTQYKKSGRWEAHIWIPDPKGKGGQKHLGSYESAEIAARCYDRAAIKTRGPGAELNFPYESYKDDQFIKENMRLSREPFFKLLRETYAIQPAAMPARSRLAARPTPAHTAGPGPRPATPATETDYGSDTSTQPPRPSQPLGAPLSYPTGAAGTSAGSGSGGGAVPSSSGGSSSGGHQVFDMDDLLVSNPLLPSLEGDTLWVPSAALPMLSLPFSPSPPLPLAQQPQEAQQPHQRVREQPLIGQQQFSLLPEPEDAAASQGATGRVRRTGGGLVGADGMASLQAHPLQSHSLLTSLSTPSLSHLPLLLPQDQFEGSSFHRSSTAPQALLTFIPVGSPAPAAGPPTQQAPGLWGPFAFAEGSLQGGLSGQGLGDSGAGRGWGH